MEDTREMVAEPVRGAIPQATVSVDWTNIEAVEPQHVNQVMTQIGNPTPDGVPDGIYLGLGAITPPIVMGTDLEAQRAQLEGTTVKVTVAGRFHMSRGLLDAIIQVLQTTASQYDAAVSQVAATKGTEPEVSS